MVEMTVLEAIALKNSVEFKDKYIESWFSKKIEDSKGTTVKTDEWNYYPTHNPIENGYYRVSIYGEPFLMYWEDGDWLDDNGNTVPKEDMIGAKFAKFF